MSGWVNRTPTTVQRAAAGRGTAGRLRPGFAPSCRRIRSAPQVPRHIERPGERGANGRSMMEVIAGTGPGGSLVRAWPSPEVRRCSDQAAFGPQPPNGASRQKSLTSRAGLQRRPRSPSSIRQPNQQELTSMRAAGSWPGQTWWPPACACTPSGLALPASASREWWLAVSQTLWGPRGSGSSRASWHSPACLRPHGALCEPSPAPRSCQQAIQPDPGPHSTHVALHFLFQSHVRSRRRAARMVARKGCSGRGRGTFAWGGDVGQPCPARGLAKFDWRGAAAPLFGRFLPTSPPRIAGISSPASCGQFRPRA